MILVTKTSDQTRQRGVRVCVCVFIELHMTVQSGPITLCHSRWSLQGGINDTYYLNICWFVRECMCTRTCVFTYLFVCLV